MAQFCQTLLKWGIVLSLSSAICAKAADSGTNPPAQTEGNQLSQPVTAAESETPTPSPELKQAEHMDLKKVVTEPLATPLPETLEAAETLPQEVQSNEIDEPEGDLDQGGDLSATETPMAEITPVAAEPSAVQEPLVMLNSEVAPGTATRLSWTPNVSFMGIAAPSAVLVVHGAKPGPKVCLTAAIHGDELNGIEVVRHVLYSINPQELAGTVIGVPIVNLQGFRRSSRYLPDRRDLNRYFPGNPNGSSASRIANSFFSGVIQHCDLLVDMHTGSFHRTNLPQLRANLLEPEVAALTRKMGSIVVVHSVGRQGCLRRAAVEQGIPAVTLEAGQPHELQKAAVTHGIKSVETLLDSLNMLDRRPFWEFKSEPVFYQSKWVRATSGGILFSEVALGDRVKNGTLLGVITDPITNSRQEISSPVSGRVIGMALNQVMYPGFAAYHIGLSSSVEELSDEPTLDDAADEDGNLNGVDAPSGETDERLLEDSE